MRNSKVGVHDKLYYQDGFECLLREWTKLMLVSSCPWCDRSDLWRLASNVSFAKAGIQRFLLAKAGIQCLARSHLLSLTGWISHCTKLTRIPWSAAEKRRAWAREQMFHLFAIGLCRAVQVQLYKSGYIYLYSNHLSEISFFFFEKDSRSSIFQLIKKENEF